MGASTSTAMSKGWKICTRGHKYRGEGGCPICWKRNQQKKPGKVRDSRSR